MNIRRIKRLSKEQLFLIALVILTLVTYQTLTPYLNIEGYKGDEVWYVDAARNYLVHEGVTPQYVAVVKKSTGPDSYANLYYYGVNVLLNVPFWNGTTINETDFTSRIMNGTPDQIQSLVPQLYNIQMDVYQQLLSNALTGVYAGSVLTTNVTYTDLLNNEFFLVGGNENIAHDRNALENFTNALENYTVTHNITVVLETIVPVMENGTTVYKNISVSFIVFKKGEHPFRVVPGYWYGDKWDIQYYYNFEHPPMGKLFEIAAIYVFGDKPHSWRIPSFIAYVIIMWATALAVLRITRQYFWAFIAALLVAIDPGLRMLGTTAMLDIFVAMFSALALLALARRNLLAAALFTGLAGAVKLNGFALALAIVIIVVIKTYRLMNRTRRTRKRKVLSFILNLIYEGGKYAGIALAAFLVPFGVISMYFPFRKIWDGFITGARWMATRGVAPHPYQSPIWEWFFNKNPFSIYSTFQTHIYVQTNWFMWLLAAVFGALGFFVTYFEGQEEEFDLVNIGMWSLWAFWFIAYALGSRTQYSYYAVQVTPFVTAVFTAAFAALFKWDELVKVLRARLGV